MSILEKISLAIDCILCIIFFTAFCYNMYIGILEHDTYYLVLSIIDYGFLRLSVKNVEKGLDTKD